ncbi:MULTISPECIES: halocarboxylic acid dehydrogenase DehI family protein [Haloferax]|uniref:halocarboxylic acid dehydrogenase DehI family protein n=1 Tax=Haloferax TaxID=2251 RepID=UPI0012B019D6|nr:MULTISPECIES: halocarboxylic acid dehydrogenase DehI family protein [Haloferax]
MTIDASKQVYESAATGWQRGLYDDIKTTFRAPVVNWFFRTLMANQPTFLRYAWGQLKPAFETRAFARYEVEYRDTVLTVLEEDRTLPHYDPTTAGISPAEFREARGQLVTLDTVIPRLAFLFETLDRALSDEPVGESPAEDWEATAPFPEMNRESGRSVTMTPFEDVPDSLAETVASIQDVHGFDSGLPTIYRSLAQWPSLLETMWDDLEPVLESTAFEAACVSSWSNAAEQASALAYTPRLSPADLRDVGMTDEDIEGLQGLAEQFRHGPVETVLPAVTLYAATLGATGPRRLG